VFGLVIGVVVSPLADRLARLGIPRVLVALAALATACLGLSVFALVLEPLIASLTAKLPKIRSEVQAWADLAREMMRGVQAISDEIERTVGSGRMETDVALDEGMPTMMDALLLAPNFGGQVLIFVGTLFFFILTRAELYEAAGAARDRLFSADRAVSRYFAIVSLVNICLGLATALVLFALGVENAVLWGFVAGVLNFMLYLGPIIVLSGLLIAGLMQFSGIYVLLPMVAFLAINLTEAQFVTPAFVGQQLRMSPLVVFLAIVVGLWLWGPIGAIVALPVLLWASVMLDGTAQEKDKSTPLRKTAA
jgi:predicted PurR-regulated permease PerM